MLQLANSCAFAYARSQSAGLVLVWRPDDIPGLGGLPLWSKDRRWSARFRPPACLSFRGARF